MTRDRRPAVKSQFDREVFEHINHIRQDRGIEWSTVILYGIAEIEQDIPPYYERYSNPPPEIQAEDESTEEDLQ